MDTQSDPQSQPEPQSATQCLQALSSGDESAHDRLLALVYAELREKAQALLALERVDHTLQPTALVHEAWFRLVDQDRVEWKSEGHFMAIAAQAMRRILLDHARKKRSAKRDAGGFRVDLDYEVVVISRDSRGPDLLAIDRALDELRQRSEQMATLVDLRFFAGLQMDEIARILGTSERTLGRQWRIARAWLRGNIRREEE